MTPRSDGNEADGRAAWMLRAPGLALALAWGIAEGSVFFLVPDIILSLTALFSVKKSLLQMALVVLGSLLSGAVLYEWSRADYPAARETVGRVPFVREAMFGKTKQNFEAFGVTALFVGPMQGIPYKVYAVEAPSHCTLPIFLFVSVPARLERLLLSWMVFAAVGFGLRRWRVRMLTAYLFHASYWLVVYAFYWIAL